MVAICSIYVNIFNFSHDYIQLLRKIMLKSLMVFVNLSICHFSLSLPAFELFFIELKFTTNKIYHFKIHFLEEFGTLTM